MLSYIKWLSFHQLLDPKSVPTAIAGIAIEYCGYYA
jgi:hypothetical protein